MGAPRSAEHSGREKHRHCGDIGVRCSNKKTQGEQSKAKNLHAPKEGNRTPYNGDHTKAAPAGVGRRRDKKKRSNRTQEMPEDGLSLIWREREKPARKPPGGGAGHPVRTKRKRI